VVDAVRTSLVLSKVREDKEKEESGDVMKTMVPFLVEVF